MKAVTSPQNKYFKIYVISELSTLGTQLETFDDLPATTVTKNPKREAHYDCT